MTTEEAERLVRQSEHVPDLELASRVYAALYGREPDDGDAEEIWELCVAVVDE